MPSSETPLALILLWSCLALLVLLVGLVFRLSRKIDRLGSPARRLEEPRETRADAPTAAETSPGGAFEEFLNEDPARRELTKSEQFAAFRQWRHEKGMNWSK